jgi:hypothetical protein
MAVETKAPPEKKEAGTPEPSPEADKKQAIPVQSRRYASIIANAVARHGLMITLAISLIANGATLAKLGSNDTAHKPLTPEVRLGEFGFVSSQAEAGQVVKADFTVYIALSEDVEEEGRRRISQRQFRLVQDVEELLRSAHSGDFDDPLLRELKQKLKERINKTLSIRAVAYVIITGMKTELNARSPVEKAEPAGMVPWVEPTAD